MFQALNVDVDGSTAVAHALMDGHGNLIQNDCNARVMMPILEDTGMCTATKTHTTTSSHGEFLLLIWNCVFYIMGDISYRAYFFCYSGIFGIIISVFIFYMYILMPENVILS